jgi:opacity protein-like surface antigen
MGGAYTAAADGVDALHYNPAGLSGMERKELGFSHARWLMDSRFDFLGLALPLGPGAIGLGAVRLGAGNQEGRDENRQAAGGFNSADSAYTVGYGIGSKWTGFGVNLKYLETRIGGDKAGSFAADAGGIHRFESVPLSLGLAVLNAGRGIRFLDQRDPLPLAISLGAAYRPFKKLLLALDLRHEPDNRRTDAGAGAEYAVLKGFLLRGGYSTQPYKTSDIAGLCGGFGLRLGRLGVDYAFAPFGELGNVQRISASIAIP